MYGDDLAAPTTDEAMRSDDRHRVQIERYVTAYNAFDVLGLLALLHAPHDIAVLPICTDTAG